MGRYLTYAVSGAMTGMGASLLLLAANVLLWELGGHAALWLANHLNAVSGAPYMLYQRALGLEPLEDNLLECVLNMLLWGGIGGFVGLAFELLRGILYPWDAGDPCQPRRRAHHTH